MSIIKCQVNSFSSCASFFIVMTHISSLNFKLQILGLSIALVKICQISHVIIFQATCSFSSNYASILSVMKDNSSLYTFVTWSILKHLFFKLSIAQVKFYQILVLLKQQISFSSNFGSIFRSST